jgi:murein DD-endopeptidase MepM/ murein hydrolase activator NlpD
MRFTPNWLLLASVAGGVVFAVISCTEVVDPTRSLVPHPRFVEGPLPHGITYTVNAPSNNDFPAAGGVPWASTGASVLPGTVARVYASGDLTLTLNSQCYEDPTWAGITSPVPPSGVGVWGGGGVAVSLATTLDPSSNPWFSPVGGGYVTYIGGYDSTPTAIMAMRTEHLGVYCTTYGPNDPPTPSVFAYYISGATNLLIDILGVSVTASSNNVRPGEAVNYSAAPINFTRTAEITWIFSSPDFAQIEVVGCANQAVCSYVPPRTGSMEVCMHDENYGICGEPRQVTVAPWINGAPPCRAKVVASYTRISLMYDSTDSYHDKPHMGQDYADPIGTPVYSADSGTVTWADWAQTAGYAVAVRSAKPDPRGLLLDSYYFHLEQGTLAVRRGQPVSAGQLLALSDDSGVFPNKKPSSHGPHVHIEQHVQTPKGPFPDSGHTGRGTLVVPCTF